jgi:hypothetical protein
MDSGRNSPASAPSCAPSTRQQNRSPAQREPRPTMNASNTYRDPQQQAPLASDVAPRRRGPYGPHLIPDQIMCCARCGVTIHPAALQHDRALLLASCCPRCDGLLVPQDGRATTRAHAAT